MLPGSHRGENLEQRVLAAMEHELAENLKAAQRLENEGHLEEAEHYLDRILELEPDHIRAREGKVRLSGRRTDLAVAAAARGRKALARGDFEAARQAFSEALRLRPALADGENGMAELEAKTAARFRDEQLKGRRALDAGRPRLAREHFTAALQLRDDRKIRQELAAVEQKIRNQADQLLNAGETAQAQQDLRQARKQYGRLLELDPGHVEVRKKLADLEKMAAKLTAERLVEANRELAAGHFSGALTLFRQVLENDPANASALDGLEKGRALLANRLTQLITEGTNALDQGRYLEAESLVRQALELDPYQAEAKAAMVRLEKLLLAGVKAGDEKHLYLQGIDLYTRGKYAEAIEVWEQVLVLTPDHEKSRLNIEKARRKLKQIQEYRNG